MPKKKSKKKEICDECLACCGNRKCGSGGKGCTGGFYFLGFLGAVIYYISTASGFWMGVLGILKAFVWPAFLIFELLKMVGA